MPRRPIADEAAALRAGSALLGLVLLASAALAWSFAREHMAALAQMCGTAGHPHCGWCYATAAFALAGLSALAAAARPRRRPITQRI